MPGPKAPGLGEFECISLAPRKRTFQLLYFYVRGVAGETKFTVTPRLRNIPEMDRHAKCIATQNVAFSYSFQRGDDHQV